MRAVTFAVVVLLLSAGASGGAGQTRDERAAPAFRFERPVDAAGSGPRRLAVDVTLLSGTRPDLADLRLFGAAGEEIPYLLFQPVEDIPRWIPGWVLPIPITEKTSGFEVDLHETTPVDAIRVSGLPVPLLKRLSLEGSGDREHWTVLLPEATLFDLPADNLQQLALTFLAGEYRYLRITWNDANSGRVPLPVWVQGRQVTRTFASRAPLSATLAVEQRSSEPGMSRYRLRLPASGLPTVSLRLVVENERVMRHAVVTEPRLVGMGVVPFELGRAALKRVVRGDAAAEALTIPITTPVGPQIDLAVDDGNNPPLKLTSVVALLARQPDVYFEATGVPVVARYGDQKLSAPRYDLAAARDAIQIETVPDAKWGEPRSLTPEEIARPAPPSATRGASIDVAGFAIVREIAPGPAGLVSLEMDSAALAHSAGPMGGFSDVRVVDREGRQIPYLLEQCVTPLVVDLRLTARQPSEAVPNGGHRSEYNVKLPYAGLPAARVVLTTDARVFTRHVAFGRARPADRSHRDPWFQPLAEADWMHDDNATAASPLVLIIPPVDDTDLVLRVDEGDNAALPVTAAKLTLPGYRLRFYRGSNEALSLAYGRPDLAPPQYDIQLLASDVLGRLATDVRASAESTQHSAGTSSLISPRVFWIVLGVAVIVLLGVMVKLVRRDS